MTDTEALIGKWREAAKKHHEDVDYIAGIFHYCADELETALLAAPGGAEPPVRSGCINCGDASDGGYMTGREGHVDEGAVGPFCSQCWDLLHEDFRAAAGTGGAETPVPADSPLMQAWEAYKRSDDYENTRKWAQVPYHTDGSLWAAFMAGFQASGAGAAPPPPREDGDDIHTGDDDLLDALTGARVPLEELIEGEHGLLLPDQIEAVKDALQGLTQADELRVTELKAGAAPPPGQGWRPIETAPKDGTNFLACSYASSVFYAHWANGVVDSAFYDEGYHSRFATHWMPLPAPPAVSQGEPQQGEKS